MGFRRKSLVTTAGLRTFEECKFLALLGLIGWRIWYPGSPQRIPPPAYWMLRVALTNATLSLRSLVSSQ